MKLVKIIFAAVAAFSANFAFANEIQKDQTNSLTTVDSIEGINSQLMSTEDKKNKKKNY